jgi:putative effector of murein hydrolase LrgA (UPF0299 family)
MVKETSVALSRKFVLSFLALIVWVSVGAAVFSFLGRNVGGAVLSGIVGLAVLVATLEGRMVRFMEERRVPKLNFMFMLIIPALVGLLEIAAAVPSRLSFSSVPVSIRSAVAIRYALEKGFSVVLALVAGYTTWQGIVLLRSRR